MRVGPVISTRCPVPVLRYLGGAGILAQIVLGNVIAYALTLLLLSVWSQSAWATPDTQRLGRWKAEIMALTRALSADLEQQQAQEQELRAIEVKLGDTVRILLGLEQRANKVSGHQETLEQRAHSLERSVREQRAMVAALTRASFSLSQRTHLQHLLGHNDISRTGRALTYARYLNEETTRRLYRLNQARKALADLREQAASRAQSVVAIIADTQSTKARLERERDERANVLAKVNLGIQTRRETLTKLTKDTARLTRLVKGLGEAVARQPPPGRKMLSGLELAEPARFAVRQGKLAWPVSGRLKRRYGTSRNNGSPRWTGDWFDAPRHTAVRAVADGQVIFSEWLRGFGLMLIIDHGEGYMTLYGHNATLLKEAGDWVDGREIVAHVGDSGGLADTGLYFEIRRQGRPLDPIRWLAPANVALPAAPPRQSIVR